MSRNAPPPVGAHPGRSRHDVPYAYLPSLEALAEWCSVLMIAVRAGADTENAVDAGILKKLGADGTFSTGAASTGASDLSKGRTPNNSKCSSRGIERGGEGGDFDDLAGRIPRR